MALKSKEFYTDIIANPAWGNVGMFQQPEGGKYLSPGGQLFTLLLRSTEFDQCDADN